ncbi:hypothetical protein QA584_09830 [Anaerocolumna sp. AGMB13025]|jgi:hypothetical protein|uniref:hypothetical protein n=1 Tax=Anaerocolumna sp. AGMB13025 TaxID=3039116 RepID=UPI00241EC94C|nr:hypothetical protein [Anaerocolumna sp. AGMB13025]WFR59366.1 hypothetical protein QA584_09830 [Anaerocolumna sp. AGMB13025]
MEELYLETKEGKVKIDDRIAQKYDLKKGTVSPFTQNHIVDKAGEFKREEPPKKRDSINQGDDEIEEMENGFYLSTSEMLDIAQGVDSDF